MADLFNDADRRCHTCGAEIVWAVNPNTGKNVPFNAAPDAERGTHAVVDGRALHKSKLAEPAELLLSHLATCPQANGRRKR